MSLTAPLAGYSVLMGLVNLWAIVALVSFFRERCSLFATRQLILFLGSGTLVLQQLLYTLLPELPDNYNLHLLGLLPPYLFYYTILYWMLQICIYYEGSPDGYATPCCACSRLAKCAIALLLLLIAFFFSLGLHAIEPGLSSAGLTQAHTAQALLTLIVIAIVMRVTYLQDDLRLQSGIGAQTAPILRRLRKLVPLVVLDSVLVLIFHVLSRTAFKGWLDNLHFPFLGTGHELNWATAGFALGFETLPIVLYLLAFTAPSATMALHRISSRGKSPTPHGTPVGKAIPHHVMEDDVRSTSSAGEAFDLQSPWMSSAGSTEPPEWLRNSYGRQTPKTGGLI